MLLLVEKNPKITISELVHEIGISTRGIEKVLSILKKEGKLERIGGAKGRSLACKYKNGYLNKK